MRKGRRKSDQGQRQDSSSVSSPDTVSSPLTSAPPPPLEWEAPSQCLGPILRTVPLPVVVMCDRSCLPPVDHVNFDFSQPLLLHTRRRVRKVVASNVVPVQHEHNDQTSLKEVGDCLLIPEDYKGWFAVLGSPSDVKPEKPVPHFRQVAQLALSKCGSFLVGGSEPVKAVQMPSGGRGGDNHAQPRLLYPGDVLRMGKLYVGESTIQVRKSKLFGSKKTVKKEEKFLLCTDDNDREVYLPVENRGTFYMLTTEGEGNPRIPILRLKDICTHYRFPCMVKLLFGCVPPTPCSFTGTLVLRSAEMESSVIGCTILNFRNILLDVPIDSDLKFFTAKSTFELLSSWAYKSAKALCHERASTYMRNMKVAYYVNNDEDGVFIDPPEESRDYDESVSQSEGVDNQSRLSRSRPSIVEDQELFCPPETSTPQPPAFGARKSTNKKSKKGMSVSEPNQTGDPATKKSSSPKVLRKDKTYSLPEPGESLPLRSSKSASSLSIESRSLPPIATPVQQPYDTLSNGNYMRMDEGVDQPSGSKNPKPSQLDSKTAPPTPPKPKKPSPLNHSQSDGCEYTQIWNGKSKVSSTVESIGEKDDDKPSTPALRPKRLGLHREAQRLSSIALADTFLTIPVLKENASSSALDDDSISSSEYMRPENNTLYYNTRSVSDSTSNQPKEESIYKVPSSALIPVKQPEKDVQPYEIMTKSNKKLNEVGKESLDEQTPPTPPMKKKHQSSHPLLPDTRPARTKPLPPVPIYDTAPKPHKIVFQNPSWIFSDTSSAQSCTYASRWLSSHQLDSSDTAYCDMQRETFPYYNENRQRERQSPVDTSDAANTPESEAKDSALDQSMEQNEMEQSCFADDSEGVYENIQNLRLFQERFSIPNSNSESLEENHAQFLDKIANPPTQFGYIKAPPPRPCTPKKPPPVPKKPSFEKTESPDESPNADAVFQSGCVGEVDVRMSFPPKPCKIHDSATFGYLHPFENRQCVDSKRCTQAHQDSGDQDPSRHPPASIGSRCSDISQQSVEDDLPLGATFQNFRSRVSDSGAPESVVESKTDSGTSDMSVGDLADALKDMGLTKDTVDILRREKVDGKLLASLDEEELREILPGIKRLDIKKIQMFTSRGWRPRE